MKSKYMVITISWRIVVVLFLCMVYSCSSGSDNDDTAAGVDNEAPSAPGQLSAADVTETTLRLVWEPSTDNVGIQHYSVYQDGEFFAGSGQTRYDVSGLDSGTAYEYKVRAEDTSGNVSEFSNTVSVTTDGGSTAEPVQAEGDVETYLNNLVANVPGSSGDHFVQPDNAQLEQWDAVIESIMEDDIGGAVQHSFSLNYQVTEFTDTSLTPNAVFYILEERKPQSRYWGTYVFARNPEKANLVLMAPHTKFDTNTGKQAIYCFKNNMARALFLNGTHRCNHNTASPCSGTTATCSSGSQAYRISDMAHNAGSVFQKTTERLYLNTSSVFVQLHGFAKKSSDPYVIMSNGTRKTPAVDYAVQIKEALLIEDDQLTFKLAHLDTGWTRLTGLTNTQGRLINDSSDPCSTGAVTTSGRFIHIEQEKSRLRQDVSGWSKMSNALNAVF